MWCRTLTNPNTRKNQLVAGFVGNSGSTPTESSLLLSWVWIWLASWLPPLGICDMHGSLQDLLYLVTSSFLFWCETSCLGGSCIWLSTPFSQRCVQPPNPLSFSLLSLASFLLCLPSFFNLAFYLRIQPFYHTIFNESPLSPDSGHHYGSGWDAHQCSSISEASTQDAQFLVYFGLSLRLRGFNIKFLPPWIPLT